jgi:hypothetical protein
MVEKDKIYPTSHYARWKGQVQYESEAGENNESE